MAYPYYQYPMYQQQMNQPMVQQMNNSFVTVRSEEEARAYPVALGNSVTFKNENAPYCYTKTMGFSQFDQPKFEKYRLVKEDASQVAQNDSVERFDTKEIDSIKEELKSLRSDFEALREEMSYGEYYADDDAVPAVQKKSDAVSRKDGRTTKPYKRPERSHSILDE